MMRFVKYFFAVTAGLFLTLVLFFLLLYLGRDSKELDFLPEGDSLIYEQDSIIKGGYLQRGENGYWNLYAKGTPLFIGNVMGSLGKELLRYQEQVFVDAIRDVIPSDSYLAFLRVLLGVYNRKLASAIPDEYKQEIFAMSQYCSDEFDIIGSPYDRHLNYHAAHDIGHAMQRYMLVGCTSFGVWGDRSKEGKLIIGRNFDFYFGDEFARNKLVSVIDPSDGYAFIAVGWPGMIGVVSGMNEKGLTVTLNASQGEIPLSSATPVSILARKILQYASNIEQAVAIAKEYNLFASEQFLIGSVEDGCCATIEKSPVAMDVVYGSENMIINTNHYRGEAFKDDSWNVENIEMSDSKRRYERVEELIDSIGKFEIVDAASLLRDTKGIGGREIGLSNQLSINQLIANHSVIFEPQGRNIWIAAGKGWQSGEFVHYNLDTLLSRSAVNVGEEIFGEFEGKCNIAGDTLFLKSHYDNLLLFREYMSKIKKGQEDVDIEKFTALNPHYYHTWVVAAEHYDKAGNYDEALRCYRRALECEVATEWERGDIKNAIEELEGRL